MCCDVLVFFGTTLLCTAPHHGAPPPPPYTTPPSPPSHTPPTATHRRAAAHLSGAGVAVKPYGALLGDVRGKAAAGTVMWMDPARVGGGVGGVGWGGWVGWGGRVVGGMRETNAPIRGGLTSHVAKPSISLPLARGIAPNAHSHIACTVCAVQVSFAIKQAALAAAAPPTVSPPSAGGRKRTRASPAGSDAAASAPAAAAPSVILEKASPGVPPHVVPHPTSTKLAKPGLPASSSSPLRRVPRP